MTAYVNPATIDVTAGKIVTEEKLTAMKLNPLAIAEGEPGAPKIAIDVGGQTAIGTDELDTSKRLAPDGAGKVVWVEAGGVHSTTVEHSGSDVRAVITISTTGTWLAQGSFEWEDTVNNHQYFAVWRALVVAGTVVHGSMTKHRKGSTIMYGAAGSFSMSGNDLRAACAAGSASSGSRSGGSVAQRV